jgi:hypothetical protein
MTKTVTAQFRSKHGDVYWKTIETIDGHPPRTMKLEGYAGVFEYDYNDHESLVYRES